MERCVQINIGQNVFKFNINIEKESDLTGSFSDIIFKYLAKDKDNIDNLKKALKSNNFKSVNLKQLVTKEVLNQSDIDILLNSYVGNTNYYNIASYFKISRRSEGLANLVNVLSNKQLSGGGFYSGNYDIILMNGAKNRIVTNGKRTMAILNPNCSTSEAESLLATVYTLNQLKEPNSKLFNDFYFELKDYNGKLAKEVNNIPFMDKAIYMFSNPELEPEVREKLNNIISNDIAIKVKLASKQDVYSTIQEDLLFDNMIQDKDSIITIGTNSATVKDIIKFKNGLWNYKAEEVSEEDFKEAFGLDYIDENLYPRAYWKYFINNKAVTNLVYSMDSIKLNNKRFVKSLQKRARGLIMEKVSVESTPINFSPYKVEISAGSSFNQNRMIKIRHDYNYDDSCLIITDGGNKLVKNTSHAVDFDSAIKNVEDIKKIIADKSIYAIVIDSRLNSNDIRKLLETYKNYITYFRLKDNSYDDVNRVSIANNVGFQVELYPSDKGNDILEKYKPIMPIYQKALGLRFIPNNYHRNLFNELENKSITSILTPVTNQSITNYKIGESFNLYNGNKPYGVKIVEKIPLYFTVNDKSDQINNNFEPGDIITYNNSGRYGYITKVDNTIHAVNLETNEFVKFDDESKVGFFSLYGVRKALPVNDGIIWYQVKDDDKFIRWEGNEIKMYNKIDFFADKLEQYSKDSRINEALISKLIKSKEKTSLYRLQKVTYNEQDVITPTTNNTKYFTSTALIENINRRLTNSGVKVVFFNSRTTKEDIGFSMKTLKNQTAFTHDGIIYLNEDKLSVSSYMHELIHVIMAALKLTDPDTYNKLLSYAENNEVEGFRPELYEGLTQNDLLEEKSAFLFGNYFMNPDLEFLNEKVEDITELITKVFNLPSNTTINQIFNIMSNSIGDMLESSNDDFSKVFKENKYQKATRLAAIKQDLMKNVKLEENCK